MNPIHLPALIASELLPVVAQRAAAEHRDLHLALAANPALADEVVIALFERRPALDHTAAVSIVSRPLTDAVVARILDLEARPEVLGQLAANTAPSTPGLRERVLLVRHTEVAKGILENPDWPLDDQVRVADLADGATLLAWLADVDPTREGASGVEGVLRERFAQGMGRWSDEFLHHDDLGTVMRAAIRWPVLLEAPHALIGPSLRSVCGTLSRDTATHQRLLDEADQAARRGWGTEAAALVEAVGLNPHASLRTQRRAARLARNAIRCHYLEGWRPSRGAGPGARGWDDARVERYLAVLGSNTAARHRTAWSALHLCTSEAELGAGAVARVLEYLRLHGRAAGIDRGTAAVALAHRDVPHEELEAALADLWPDASQEPVGRTPSLVAELAGCDPDGTYTDVDVETDAVALTAHFAGRSESWALAIVLLRDGWDHSLTELVDVVSKLTTEPEVAA